METITSHSGMTHLVNPKPQYTSNGKGLAAGRTQTFREMHIRPDQCAAPDGRKCEFCRSEAARAEGRRQ